MQIISPEAKYTAKRGAVVAAVAAPVGGLVILVGTTVPNVADIRMPVTIALLAYLVALGVGIVIGYTVGATHYVTSPRSGESAREGERV